MAQMILAQERRDIIAHVARYHIRNAYKDWHESRIHLNSNPFSACLAAVAEADQDEVKQFTSASLGGPSPSDEQQANVKTKHPDLRSVSSADE